MKTVTCKPEGKDIVIRIPKDLLIFVLEEENRIGYSIITIVNKRKFFKEFCKNILEYGEQEDGSTKFTDLLDGCVEEMYINGSESITGYDEDRLEEDEEELC